jgi:hypothetical protein
VSEPGNRPLGGVDRGAQMAQAITFERAQHPEDTGHRRRCAPQLTVTTKVGELADA